MKIFNVVLVLTLFSLFSITALAQNPPTNAPQFEVGMNFFGGTPYGVQSAMDSAFTDQFTTNIQLRGDIIAMPAANYTGYFGGPQYNLCGITALESLLSTTSLNCGKSQFYANGAVGLGRIQVGTNAANNSLAGLIRAGMNYDLTGSGHVTANIFECGWGSFGLGARSAWFCQTGFKIGLGSSASATQSKLAQWQRSQVKKQKKLQEKMEKQAKWHP